MSTTFEDAYDAYDALLEAQGELSFELEELRAKYNEICQTSAMLRADMAAARDRQAKLRELCADLYDFADRAEYATDREWKSYSDRASELGVEVEA